MATSVGQVIAEPCMEKDRDMFWISFIALVLGLYSALWSYA
jgi:hypothetical protein